MPIYITKVLENNYLSLSPYRKSDLVCLYYKTEDGPVGFCNDEISKRLYIESVCNTVWYSEFEDNFEYLSSTSLQNNSIFRSNGIYFIEDLFIKNEIEKENKHRIIKKQNEIRKRHSKQTVEIESSFFTSFYDKKNNRYFPLKIDHLITINVQFAVGHYNSLGNHFIMIYNSIFFKNIVIFSEMLGINVKTVETENDIPPW